MSKIGRSTAPWLLALAVLASWAEVARAESIEGAVYDSASGRPLQNVPVRLFFDDDDPLTPGALVPADNLTPGQAAQSTGSGGRYRFDLRDIGASRTLRIAVETSALRYTFPSTRLTPSPGQAPSGPVVPSFDPLGDDSGALRTYFLRFAPTDTAYEVSNNHIPLDAFRRDVSLRVTASRGRAEVGDVISYSVELENRLARDLDEVYALVTPARGLDFAGGVSLRSAGQTRELAVATGSSGDRFVRLGPFSIGADSSGRFDFRAVVGADTRPGRTETRVALIDGAGSELTEQAVVVTEIERGRGLDASVIIGRVFCDSDGDGAPGSGEVGVFGARVYIDSGSYAVTDSAGLYHFSRVAEGTRYVKLDAASLSGSQVIGGAGRLLRLAHGLAERANFGVACASERVSGKSQDVALSHATRPLSTRDPGLDQSIGLRFLIEGDLLLVAVKVDGNELDLPSAAARLEAPTALRLPGGGGINLVPVPVGGYGAERPRFVLGAELPHGVAAARWTFTVSESANGRLGKAFFTIEGEGEPPAAIDWDGRGSDGSFATPDVVYVAQLVVIGATLNVEAASGLIPFGIAYGRGSSGPTSVAWRGRLLAGTGQAPTATTDLAARVSELAATLAAGDTIEVEVHAGRSDSRVEALATTQRGADVIKSLLVAEGISAAAIVARGRGVAEPIATGEGAEETNRRVEVTVTRQGSGAAGAVPSTFSTNASALIDGKPAEIGDGGRFRWEGGVPVRGALLVDIQAQDGRRAAIDVTMQVGAEPRPPVSRFVEVDADIAVPRVRVGEVELDARLLAIDFRVAGTPPDYVIEPEIPVGLEFRRGEIRLADGGGSSTVISFSAGQDRVAVPKGLKGPLTCQVFVELANTSRALSPRRALDGSKTKGQASEVVVNGVAWPLEQGRARAKVSTSLGQAILVDATTAAGNRAIYVVASGTDARDLSPRVPLGPDPSQLRLGSRSPVSPQQLASSRAADFWIDLPPVGAKVSAAIAVRGQTRTGNKVSLNGVAVAVAGDGSFAHILELASGADAIIVHIEDEAGFRADLRWPVAVRDLDLFGMGLAEVMVSTSATERGFFADTAYLAGMSPETTWAAGPVLISGRATVYARGEYRGSSTFETVRFTAHLDTSKRPDGSAFFEDVLNPVRDEPTFGDSAIEVRDTNGHGKLYLRVEVDKSEALVGAIATELGKGRFFRYGRTVDGAGLRAKREFGSHRVELDAFATVEAARSSRDHVTYRSTGGTLYYFRFADVIEGSELVRVIVRDRDSGLVSSERVLVRNLDYTVDYVAGRIWLLNPVSSSEDSAWVLSNSDASLTPDSGNPLFIEVRYEHRGGSGMGERAGGFEARYGVGGLDVALGAVTEWREEADDYGLLGARASFTHSDETFARAEIAESKRRSAATRLSVDGGLTFRDVAATAAIENPRENPGHAWHLGAQIGGEDISPRLSGSRAAVYVQRAGLAFAADNTDLDRGRLRFGALATFALSRRDDLSIRHQGEIADVPRIGPTADDIPLGDDAFDLDERATYLTSIGWVGRRGALTHRVEAAHQRLSSTAARSDGSASLDARRLGVGGRSSVALTKVLTLSASQEIWTAARDADPLLNPIDPSMPSSRQEDRLAGVTTGLGIAWQLLPDAAFTTELRQRWNGDQSAAVGLRAKLSETGSFFIGERAERGPDGPAAVTVIGADDRFGPGGTGRSYGEYQIENTGHGARNRAVLGLGQRAALTKEIGVGIGFEHQQVFGGFLPDGTPVGNNQRDLIRASLDVAPSARLRAGAVAELRADRVDSAAEIDRSLVESDPRDPSGDGFADHGGVAAGAPLIANGGDQTQLVVSAGLTWRLEEGVSLFGRGRAARTFRGASVGFSEVTTGLVYRSLFDDRLALLMRYTFLRERRPEAELLEQEDAHILAIVPVADLSAKWRLSGKLAFKRSAARGGLAEAVGQDAFLALARLGYRIYGNWDATVEGRALALRADQVETRVGSLVELGYYFNAFLRLGVGYNFSHFNDQELGDLTRDAHGLFLRLSAEI